MKTNTELLMNALGWQGGTVHQVAQETGLSVLEILSLDKYYPADSDIRAITYHFAGKRRCEEGLSVVGYDWQGYDNVMYWCGVLDAMKEKESGSLK